MDVTQLAQSVTEFLGPFLPYLRRASEQAAEEAGKKLGAIAWEKAKAIWAKLRAKMGAEASTQEAAQDVANAPGDVEAQATLFLQLKKLLAEDGALAKDVAQIWEETKAAGVTIITAGDRSVVAQRIEDSTIITGDQNVVNR